MVFFVFVFMAILIAAMVEESSRKGLYVSSIDVGIHTWLGGCC